MEITIAASEFKAKCLDILRRLGERRLSRVTITHRGTPVAVMTAPPPSEQDARSIIGSMAGTVWIDPDLDLTQPAFDGEMDAEKGILYRD
ncbi:MAG TPA: prevent-host-death protein [Allosphingosinicella sp.]|jgi:antitoxin (DNA-binding transcriptional repressor) of toxin-antitoxin stability system